MRQQDVAPLCSWGMSSLRLGDAKDCTPPITSSVRYSRPMPREPSLRWYARPVLFVSDVVRSLRFYVDQLGFEERFTTAPPWDAQQRVGRWLR